MIRNKLLYLALMLLGLWSCGPETYFIEEKKLDGQWALQDTLIFNLEAEDTINAYDFYVHLEHSNEYPYRNFFLYSQTAWPNGKFSQDTIEMYLARPDGKWLGSKWLGSNIRHKILFKRKSRFPVSGVYSMRWVHGLRDTLAPSFYSVGLSIEKSR